MKFRNAKFINFRLLKDLTLDFSSSESKPLTVIRAENETGKTTLLHALQWVLFGDEGLPRGGNEFRIHPIDWDINKTNVVEIEVILEFENDDEYYIAHRTVKEEILPPNNWKRYDASFDLFRKEESGYKPVRAPELHVKSILGSDLKDLFFTDGDRALSFISSEITTGDKRKLVKGAIRDMLSFHILEYSIAHVQKSTVYFRNSIKDYSEGKDLSEVAVKLNNIEIEVAEHENRLTDIDKQLSNLTLDIRDIENKIEGVLSKGDKKALVNEKQKNEIELKILKGKELEFIKEHSLMLYNEDLCLSILRDDLKKGSKLLNDLKRQGKIPKTSIPVLKERLEMGICICGERLILGDDHYKKVEELIKQQEQESDYDDRLTILRLIANQKFDIANKAKINWPNKLKDLIESSLNVKNKINELESDLKEIDHKISKIPGTDIESLRKQKSAFMDAKDNLLSEKGLKEHKLSQFKIQQQKLNEDFNKLSKHESKAKKIISCINAAEDIHNVIKNSYIVIEKSEIPLVSLKMNEYFMQMIRTDPSQNAIINKAFIDDNYDIKVYGPNKNFLDPDQDLNGASRRALTLSFILALTQVSDVKAPNIIDTPLGMMDPLVKKSVLETCANNSHQLILFLTRSEIRDVESVIDKYTDRVITLSNSSHYPKMLVNKIGKKDIEIVRCDCNHRQYCNICERIEDRENNYLVINNNE